MTQGLTGKTAFGYDETGNTTSMVMPTGAWTYGYDYENRLVSVTNPNYTANHTYAPDGLRLRAQESNHQYPDRWFQYDGVRPTQEGTLDGDDWTSLARYEWEGNSYYDPLVTMLPSGFTWRHPLYDGLGSTRQLLDDDQTVTDTYQYEAFGNLLGSTGSTPNPYRYVGSLGYYQTGSSLQHLGARYYLPEVGRFTARDAVHLMEETASRYAYTANHPTVLVDPDGLRAFTTLRRAYTYLNPVVGGACAAVVASQMYGQKFSNRYKHCVASCVIAQECGTHVSWAAGHLKEVQDVVLGHVHEGSAKSAFQPSDFADNAAGRKCKEEQDCSRRCQKQGIHPWTPDAPPGPFYPYYPAWWGGQRAGWVFW